MTTLDALTHFSDILKKRFDALGPAEPEEQLRGPLENLVAACAHNLNRPVVLRGEHRLKCGGRPDYAVSGGKDGRLLAGFIELKQPGKGADPECYKGHDQLQWQRFKDMPNLIYSDGIAWSLYRSGELIRQISLPANLIKSGAQVVRAEHAQELETLLLDFLDWEPLVPDTAEHLAEVLAPLCRLLRQEVAEALGRKDSPLHDVAESWRHLLFPDADDATFADGYAQTVTFALLLAHSEGQGIESIHDAVAALRSGHLLLAQVLNELTVDAARNVMEASFSLLTRTVAAIPESAVTGQGLEPWLYFYEHFLAVYDPELRRDAGVYYTPREVVRAQVRLVDDLLRTKLDKPFGFAEQGVVTLDPAAGTGAYLLGVIEHSLSRIEQEQGAGAVPGHAQTLAGQLNGFEYMVGPYSVAQLRLDRALRERGASMDNTSPRVFLTDTMEAPTMQESWVPLSLRAVADQHRQALEVKDKVPVFVCLGNPPYDRHSAGTRGKGGWVRHGAQPDGADAIFRQFTDPVKLAGHGGHLKNLYNLYVYFWRWALWKVFEHPPTVGHSGVVSFITASSYLLGKGFAGMREHMRRLCDEIWVIDLGGEGRGARQEENVFAIQTPVAIAIAVRYGKTSSNVPAAVRYVRLRGTRSEKLAALAAVDSFVDLPWQDCSSEWQAPFRPAGEGAFFGWPRLTDIMPWQHSGVQFKRTWPIAGTKETLQRRWEAFLQSPDRGESFRETRDRKVGGQVGCLFSGDDPTPLLQLASDAPLPKVKRYGFRSFDRQYVLADNRLADFIRPVLWKIHSDEQIFFASAFTTALDKGPAITVSPYVSDMHFFNNRGAKDIVPLYRDAAGTEPNLLTCLTTLLTKTYDRPVTAEDVVAYCFGILSSLAYAETFHEELESCDIRVPLTRDRGLFNEAVELGRELVWLQTWGERWNSDSRPRSLPQGRAKCTVAIPTDRQGYPKSFSYDSATETLHVGEGRFAPVAPEVWGYKVSGLQVVDSWLGYRMGQRSGRRSSPLDDIGPETWTAEMTTELLTVLWILEHTLTLHPRQARVLDRIIGGPLLPAGELPHVPAPLRQAPGEKKVQLQCRLTF